MSKPTDEFSHARKIFDDNAKEYSEIIEESFLGLASHDFFVQSKVEIFREQLASLSMEGKAARVLDVGCGNGLLHQYIKLQNIALHGVDISDVSLQAAKKCNAEVNYQHFDGEKIPYPDGEFDITFAICVLHHVPPLHWQNLVKEMVRVTRAGGVLFIHEHNPYNPGTQWVVRRCPLDEGVVLLPYKKLQNLFKGAGLNKMQTRHILLTPFKGKFFRQLDRYFEKLPFGTQYFISATKPGK